MSQRHEPYALSPALPELLARAERIGLRAAQEAPQTEQRGHLSDELMADLVASDLIGVLQPRRFGGLELGFPEFVRIGEVIASHDISAGWIYCILGAHHWWGALSEPAFQQELWGDDPHRMFADVFAPMGEVTHSADGLVLSGSWKFASGVLWSDYVCLGAMGRYAPGEDPEYLMMFVPREELRIEDDWHTMGLRGTASCGVTVERALVPWHRIVRMGQLVATGQAPGHAINPAPLYRPPFGPGLAIAIVLPSIGGPQGMVRLFKQRMHERVPLFTNERQDEMVASQILLADCATRTAAQQALAYRYADELMQVGQRIADGRMERAAIEEFRLRTFGWRAFIGAEGRAVADKLFQNAGAFSIYDGAPIQRHWRDMYAMAQHLVINYEVGMRNYGRHMLGMEPAGGLY